jgi:hypothetical protein
MEAVATIGAYGLSIVNKPLQFFLKDEVKTAFDNATGNKIFSRKYKVETSAEGKVWCILKICKANLKDINQLQHHCLRKHGISFSVRGEFILNIELKQRKIGAFDMSSEDAGSIKNLPESVSISNDCVKAAGIIGESSASIADNDLQYILKDEVINAFENYIGDNNYGGKYKIAIVDDRYECIIKRCELSYKNANGLYYHCQLKHDIKIVVTGRYIIAIEKSEIRKSSSCRMCGKFFRNRGSLRKHCYRTHKPKYTSEDGALVPIMTTSNESSKIDKPDTGKIQDNTNAINTTTNSMDSNSKRSYFFDRYYEESNAKKAMLNPSESGYSQSAPASQNIDDDKELLELALELAENNSDFQYALEKDVSDKYATSRDFY